MYMKTISSYMLAAALVISPLMVNADMVDTTQLLAHEDRLAHVQQVEAFMASEGVRGQLEAMGVTSENAAERVAAMTDSQLQQLASNIENMPAGADALGVLVTVLVVILLLEILGITNVSNRI